ncbi:2-hydroxy-6-oxo-6-phenylhexa-2,4-dienoate hydrolase [Solibacillus isronensis B3W22]|uniref:2-hydroxy-6-oxo-6-phenylhexa-2,4-dienoate hydrolase n=1 Tax=Solibacillus isronensis B3W22 TaxID=1224748 RepID=K1KYQ1_9BACL|nr:alpha/beta hydrolase [Solibacillus isronensis]AMO84057.1 3-oxoadipate enol-lactonase [Solibacillus silvestris]EKB44992.1 2-hydroxy-6-oxo-6-phenylhexa-2,4-dienoate hydrolase [Solibacillus isronensis B3W22]
MNKLDVLAKVELSNGETLSYRKREGGDELVLLVHGNMTSSKHWDLLLESMDERFTIYAVDMRGFGESTYNKRITSIKDFSDDIKLFVDALELRGFTIIGWSTGGNVAMQFCADYPDYSKKLVLFASGSTRGYPFYSSNADGTPDFTKRLATIEQIEQDPVKTIPMQQMYDTKNRDGLKFVWNSVIYTQNQPDEARYEQYVDDMLTQRNLADVYHALNTFNISAVDNEVARGTNQVKDIHIPTFVLYGDRDFVVTGEMTTEIIEDFEGRAQIMKLANCGHSPLVDSLDETKEAIEEFILS